MGKGTLTVLRRELLLQTGRLPLYLKNPQRATQIVVDFRAKGDHNRKKRPREEDRMEFYATLGDPCAKREVLEKLFRAGMTGIRVNLSHTSQIGRASCRERV